MFVVVLGLHLTFGGLAKGGTFTTKLDSALRGVRQDHPNRGGNLLHNVLQLQEVGDFEAQNCLPALNLIRTQMFI
jgi:hypothetical protein